MHSSKRSLVWELRLLYPATLLAVEPAIGTEDGPAGGTLLRKTTFIQRLNTKGGLAPSDGCFTANDVGKQALVP